MKNASPHSSPSLPSNFQQAIAANAPLKSNDGDQLSSPMRPRAWPILSVLDAGVIVLTLAAATSVTVGSLNYTPSDSSPIIFDLTPR